MQLTTGSLRRKLLLAMLLTTLVALVVALGAMIAYDLRAYRQGWVDDTAAQAELIARTTAPALAFDDAHMARENLALLRFQPKVRAAAIYLAHGGLFATYVAEGANTEFPALPGTDGTTVDSGRLTVFKRVVDNSQILGTVYVRSEYELYDHLLHYAGIAVLVAALAMLVAGLLSSWLRRIVIQPILDIGDAARGVVGQRDYSRRVNKSADDELGALVDAFNDMMGEVEQRTAALEASNQDKAREVDERRGAQQEVMRLNQELEQRVHERTAQLERSNSELALATTAAEEANRAKSDFLSNMSHELRTPLNAVIGFGQLLAAADARTMPPQRHAAYVDHIVKAGDHLLTLINDILNLAQIEAGKLSVSVESVNLSDVLEECRNMTEPQAARRNIRLLFPAPDGLQVRADRTRLKQVLLNLLSNAVKYNRDMGSVIVDCVAIRPERLRIVVQDTGQGMRSDQLQALFQPFNRLGQEGGTHEGTGIGLVVTRHLVELMGGEMGVNSTVGTGTSFWVELDRTPPAASAASRQDAKMPVQEPSEAPSESDAAASNGRAIVLCVEDNPASLQLIEEALASRHDVRLLKAENGQVGIELARAHRPDVILMDNNMPVLRGSEAQAILRGDPRTSHIPIIAISANAMAGAAQKGLAAGFFRYLTKPVNIQQLLEALDGALKAAADAKKH